MGVFDATCMQACPRMRIASPSCALCVEKHSSRRVPRGRSRPFVMNPGIRAVSWPFASYVSSASRTCAFASGSKFGVGDLIRDCSWLRRNGRTPPPSRARHTPGVRPRAAARVAWRATVSGSRPHQGMRSPCARTCASRATERARTARRSNGAVFLCQSKRMGPECGPDDVGAHPLLGGRRRKETAI